MHSRWADIFHLTCFVLLIWQAVGVLKTEDAWFMEWPLNVFLFFFFFFFFFLGGGGGEGKSELT